MRRIRFISLLSLLAAVALTVFGYAETKVRVSDMHLCCRACGNGVTAAVAEVEGASVVVHQEEGSVTVTATDSAAVQKALDAIGAAGYHGKTDHNELTIRDDSGAKSGKVKWVELTGAHNCCGGCNRAIKEAVSAVDGVVADTAEPKSTSFVVEGEFDALELVQSLYDAGFHVRVK
jgi:copper chaperone CopZ